MEDSQNTIPLSKGEIGKTITASQEKIEALASRSEIIAKTDTFYLDDIVERVSHNSQYANLLQQGKIKAPKYDTTDPKYILSEILSLDSQYFKPNYLTGESSLTTAYDIKSKQPISFEKMTPYQKEFFGQGGTRQGTKSIADDIIPSKPDNIVKPSKPDNIIPSKKSTDTIVEPSKENPNILGNLLETLSKEKKVGALADLRGANGLSKSSKTESLGYVQLILKPCNTSEMMQC